MGLLEAAIRHHHSPPDRLAGIPGVERSLTMAVQIADMAAVATQALPPESSPATVQPVLEATIAPLGWPDDAVDTKALAAQTPALWKESRNALENLGLRTDR